MFQYEGLTKQQCELFTQFAEYLRAENRSFNLTRILETEEIYLRHFADALEMLPWLDASLRDSPRPRLIDVGSGAGLPGLAIAVARSDWEIVSLEATGKKVDFQRRLIDHLQLTNAQVCQGRAEELAHMTEWREQFDAVTARALAHLKALAELCSGFARVGAKLVFAKGADCEAELDAARPGLAICQLALETCHAYSTLDLAAKMGTTLSGEAAQFSLLVVGKQGNLASRYPRSWARIKKDLSIS